MTAQPILRFEHSVDAILRRGIEVIKIEAEALDLLADSLDVSFAQACEEILAVSGRVVRRDPKARRKTA